MDDSIYRPRTLVHMIEDAYDAGEIDLAVRYMTTLRATIGDQDAREQVYCYTDNVPVDELWETATPEPENAPAAVASNADAIAAYLDRIAQASLLLDRLEQYLDDNGGVAPDAVDWAHVGSMGHICELLREVTRFAFNEEE